METSTSIGLADLARTMPQDARYKALFQRGATDKLDSCLEIFTRADHTAAEAAMGVEGLRDLALGLRESVKSTTASLQSMHEQNQGRFKPQLGPANEEKINFGPRMKTDEWAPVGGLTAGNLVRGRRTISAEELRAQEPTFKDAETGKYTPVHAHYQSLPTNYPQSSLEAVASAVDDLVTFFSSLSNVPAPLAAALSVAGIRNVVEIKDHLSKMVSLAPAESKFSARSTVAEFSGKKALTWRTSYNTSRDYLTVDRELGSAPVAPAMVFMPDFKEQPKPWHAIEMSATAAKP